MSAPHNPFKQALENGTLQLGCWLGLADPNIAELLSGPLCKSGTRWGVFCY